VISLGIVASKLLEKTACARATGATDASINRANPRVDHFVQDIMNLQKHVVRTPKHPCTPVARCLAASTENSSLPQHAAKRNATDRKTPERPAYESKRETHENSDKKSEKRRRRPVHFHFRRRGVPLGTQHHTINLTCTGHQPAR
jgi:hypothetical protein